VKYLNFVETVKHQIPV